MKIYTHYLSVFAGANLLLATSVWANDLTVTVVNPDREAVSDLVVYVTPITNVGKLPVNTEQLIIDQAETKFSPYVTVLQKGQSIKFVNKDDITHHIYSVSGDNRFEFKIKAGTERLTQQLMASEEVAMGCNIHDWMSGFALVVDTPYFGKTDEQGQLQFELPSVGKYQVTVWHPQLDVSQNRVSQALDVQAASQSYTFELPKKLLPIPEQSGQNEFDFLEEY